MPAERKHGRVIIRFWFQITSMLPFAIALLWSATAGTLSVSRHRRRVSHPVLEQHTLQQHQQWWYLRKYWSLPQHPDWSRDGSSHCLWLTTLDVVIERSLGWSIQRDKQRSLHSLRQLRTRHAANNSLIQTTQKSIFETTVCACHLKWFPEKTHSN